MTATMLATTATPRITLHPRDGVITRPGQFGTDYLAYVRFCGNRAESVAWTRNPVEASKGLDRRTLDAVRALYRR